MKISVLITCFNRVNKTLAGLTDLFAAAAKAEGVEIEVFLVDDASPDGTGAIVARTFPQVHVISGTGNLYWNRGMCLAYAHARNRGMPDAYLLFNDDVRLMPDGLRQITSAYQTLNYDGRMIMVGPMISAINHRITYGGYNAGIRFRPLNFIAVEPDGTLRECDTFNGNCTLVPAKAMDEVGGLDPAFHHAYGDLDLGLVLRKRGCRSFVLPSPIGYCETNPPAKLPPVGKRLIAMFTPPNPVSDRVHFTYKRFSWPVAALLAAGQLISSFFKVFVPRRDSWEH